MQIIKLQLTLEQFKMLMEILASMYLVSHDARIIARIITMQYSMDEDIEE